MHNSETVSTLPKPQPQPSEEAPANALRIWAISEYYFPNFSGAAIQAHRILGALVNRGHQVCVLTTADQDAKVLAGKQVRVDGLQVKYLPVLRRFSWRWLPFGRSLVRSVNELFRRVSFDCRVLFHLMRHGRRNDIVQFYVVGELTRLVIAYANLRGMKPVIQISLCGADDPLAIKSSFLGISSRLTKSCFFAVHRVISLSSALLNSCREFGLPDRQLQQIPNGVDAQRFKGAEPETRDQICKRLKLDPQKQFVVFVGSAIHRKGIDVVIPAFIELAEYNPNVDLLIVGPCDFSDHTRHPIERKRLVDELREKLDRFHLADRVHWVGEVEDVDLYLRVASVFFFPTRREGLPNALAEAMASQLPAVASQIEGVTTDLVASGVHGILVDGYEPTQYAEALREIFADDEKRHLMSRAARQRIEREFELSHIAARYEGLYNDLVGNECR